MIPSVGSTSSSCGKSLAHLRIERRIVGVGDRHERCFAARFGQCLRRFVGPAPHHQVEVAVEVGQLYDEPIVLLDGHLEHVDVGLRGQVGEEHFILAGDDRVGHVDEIDRFESLFDLNGRRCGASDVGADHRSGGGELGDAKSQHREAHRR